MSSLGKILLWAAVAGTVASAILGGFVIQSRFTDASNLHTAQQNAQSAQQEAKAADKKAADATQAATDANNKLVQANSSVDDLKKQIATLQDQAAQAAKAQADAQANEKTADDALNEIKQKLNGKTPEDYIAAEKTAEDNLAAAQAEKKIMDDQMQKLQKQVADAQDELTRATNHIGNKPGVSGKITFVDRTWNFVILDVGLSDGVVPNGELIVYRGRTFLGKVRITKADQNDSVAEIMPDAKGSFQIGDAVLD